MEDQSSEDILKVMNSMSVRMTKSYDIYSGPVIIGTVEDTPGYITEVSGRKTKHK